MNAPIGGLAGNGEARIVLEARGKTVGGHGEFQRHHRPAVRDAQDVAKMRQPRLCGAQADFDVDPGSAQPCVTLPRRSGIGIFDRADDACDASFDKPRRAGRAPDALVRARLQRHVKRRAARALACLVERDALAVRAPAGRR